LLLGRVLPVLILFLITIIYSRKLSFDEYGKFQSVWMYANIVNVIITFGLTSVIFSTNLNFLFSFIKIHQKKLSIFYSLLWIIGLAAFYLFAKNFTSGLKLLLVAFIIIQNVSTIAETLLIKRQGEKASFIINFIYSVFFLAWHLYVLFTDYSLMNLIFGICVISILKLMAMLMIPFKQGLFVAVANEKHFLDHWAFLGLNDILGVISKWIDKFFLLYILTATDFAIFFNGSFEIPLFGLLISVMGSFLMIEISKNVSLTSKIVQLYRESFLILSTLVFPLFFFLFFFRNELFALVFNNKYDASLPVFVISIFILPLRINNYSVILQCFSKGKTILIGSIFDISIAIILMLVLYPLMGTQGIALAVVVATFCQVIFYILHSAKTLHVSVLQVLPLQKLLLRFLIAGVSYFILFLILTKWELKIKLLVGVIFTTFLILIGFIKYFKTFFKKEYVQNPKDQSEGYI
jgi:O-antigen/teichoic acid export membrane protein